MSIEDSIVRLKLTHILWICLIGVLIIRALVRRWKHRKIYAFMASLPGPIGFPFVGSLHLFLGITMNNVYEFVQKITSRYPKLFGLWMGETPSIFIGDPEILNVILSSTKSTDKFSHYEFMHTGTPGILSKQGEDWRTMRKMLNPGFSATNFPTFDKNFQHHTRTFMQELGKRADGKEFDIFLLINKCTLDFALDNIGNHRADIQLNNLEFLASDTAKCAEMLFERLFQPLLWPDFLYRLSGKEKEYRKPFNMVVNWAKDLIVQQMEDAARLSSTREKAWAHSDILLRNYEAGNISKECLITEMKEMIIAASITSAIADGWVVKMMAMFPDIQEKAYQEILENCDGVEVTADDLSKLVYLEMIIKESLRLFVPPLTGRKINEDLQVNEKLTIPGGTEVFLMLHRMHHDPEYWQKPHEFYPEHFSDENVKSRPKGAYAPFLSGPRGCPGYKYAMRSMKIVLANVILKYRLSTDERPPKDLRDIKCRLVFLPMPHSGYKVKVTPRPKLELVTASASSAFVR